MKPETNNKVRALSRQEPRHEPQEKVLPRINSAPPDTFPVAQATPDQHQVDEAAVEQSRTPSINSGSMMVQNNTEGTSERSEEKVIY